MIRGGFRFPAVIAAVVLVSAGGCGGDVAAPSAEQQLRAAEAGFDAELVYVITLEGYTPAPGENGPYGNAGYQAMYTSDRGAVFQLIVERTSIDSVSCPRIPVAGTEPTDAIVQCTPDGQGWRRVSGDRHEYAVMRGDRLIRVCGPIASTTAKTIRAAAVGARPAGGDELDSLLPLGSAEGVGENRSLGQHLVGDPDGQVDPVGQRTGQQHPRVTGAGQPLAEPGGHVRA